MKGKILKPKYNDIRPKNNEEPTDNVLIEALIFGVCFTLCMIMLGIMGAAL